MASAVDTNQDNAQGDLTTQAGPSPPAESGATPPLSRTLSRINTDLASRDSHRTPSESNHGGDNDGALHSALSNTSSITSPPPYWPHASHQRNISNLSTESFLPAEAIRLRDNDANDDDRNSACWAKSVEITDFIFVNGSNTNIGAFIVWNISVETMNVSSMRLLDVLCVESANLVQHVYACVSASASTTSYKMTDQIVSCSKQGSYMNIRKRYSEFDDFRRKLTQSFPNFRAAVPELPPKSALFKFRPKFLEKRRAGLQYFLKYGKTQQLFLCAPCSYIRLTQSFCSCILLNPEFSGSPVLKDFLFA